MNGELRKCPRCEGAAIGGRLPEALLVVVTPAKRAVIAALPARTVHALHGLLVASQEAGAPVTAAEACLYDFDAVSPRATARSLRHGASLGYCLFDGTYWWPLNPAHDMKYAIEERTLADEDSNTGTERVRFREGTLGTFSAGDLS